MPRFLTEQREIQPYELHELDSQNGDFKDRSNWLIDDDQRRPSTLSPGK